MTDTRLDEEHQPEQFRFESPGAGAYRVKLMGDDVANTASMLFAGYDDFSSVSLSPGTYTAIIEPIGSGETIRQPVELRRGAPQPIKLLDVTFERASQPPVAGSFKIRLPEGVDRLDKVVAGNFLTESEPATTKRPTRYGMESLETVVLSLEQSVRRDFSLALSVRHARDQDDQWRPSRLSTTVTDQPGGGIAIVFRKPPDWRQRPIWRLTAAVEGDPRWRMRIPLFNGGLQVVLTPTATINGPDLAVTVAPRSSGRAALVSNLESMFLGSATEVVRSTLPAFRDGGGDDLIAYLTEIGEDPWTVTAAALLLARTEELAPMSASLRAFARKWRWLPDLSVLLAWIAARDKLQDREMRERECLALLKDIPGRPYFAAAQTLGQDLLTGLALGGSEAVRSEASMAREKWGRLSSRQIPTGAFLAAEDGRLAKGVTLDRRNYDTFATGVVKAAQIEIAQSTPTPQRGNRKIPALSRAIVSSSDPWKGRFGGHAERAGFTLEARFARGPAQWVELELLVRGPGKDREVVELFLHDSFHPDRLKLKFSNGVASCSTLAWGGFTVGAWLPTREIELELDLAQIHNAPAVIREF